MSILASHTCKHICSSSILLAYEWCKWSRVRAAFTCENPQTYTAHAVVNGLTHSSSSPLRVLTPKHARRTVLRMCAVMYTEPPSVLEFLQYHSVVQGFSHFIVMSPHASTVDSLKWLQVMFSPELVHLQQSMPRAAMVSACSALAQPQCM